MILLDRGEFGQSKTYRKTAHFDIGGAERQRMTARVFRGLLRMIGGALAGMAIILLLVG